MNPPIIASCIAAQNSTLSTGAWCPNARWKMTNCNNAMRPYMPTCQAVRDNVSALSAATMTRLLGKWLIGAMVKY